MKSPLNTLLILEIFLLTVFSVLCKLTYLALRFWSAQISLLSIRFWISLTLSCFHLQLLLPWQQSDFALILLFRVYQTWKYWIKVDTICVCVWQGKYKHRARLQDVLQMLTVPSDRVKYLGVIYIFIYNPVEVFPNYKYH